VCGKVAVKAVAEAVHPLLNVTVWRTHVAELVGAGAGHEARSARLLICCACACACVRQSLCALGYRD
jgi:hypothetical protein